MGGFEPPTFRLQGESSTRLSYIGASAPAPAALFKPFGAARGASFIEARTRGARAMARIRPRKLRIMTVAFLATGAAGIAIGLGAQALYGAQTFYVTFLGTINLCLGGLSGWLYLTRRPRRGRHAN